MHRFFYPARASDVLPSSRVYTAKKPQVSIHQTRVYQTVTELIMVAPFFRAMPPAARVCQPRSLAKQRKLWCAVTQRRKNKSATTFPATCLHRCSLEMASCGVLRNNSTNNKSSVVKGRRNKLCFWIQKTPSFQNPNPSIPFDLPAATRSQVVFKTQKVHKSGNWGHVPGYTSTTKNEAPDTS